MTQPTKPSYVLTEPPGEDLYEGQPQRKVALPIADLLKEGKFKLIGLDGSWGAGKSNVVRILEKELGLTHHFFLYDAWAHQEDLQRRAFLEEFTADLVTQKVVKSVKWEDDLKDLLAKKKETITKTIPKISPAYYAIALTIVLLSLSKSFAELVEKSHPYWKIIITISPVLLLLLAWIIAACVSKKYWDIPSLFAIYKEKDLEKETTETISEKEPSVREFRDWMSRLSKDLNKNVVVVFDNIDRLPKEKVKVLWSAIQTFFSEAKDQYPRISFIVPFDRAHISKAFDEQDIFISTHFINKTFPVIFNVSLPPLTGWKGFFQIKYIEAFNDKEDAEYEVVESIFDLYHDVITPRSIISFINDLVTLKLIWKDEIAMQYIALFVAARKEILDNPLDQILKRTFVAKAELYFKADDDLPKNIAALVYNVPLDKASQVTLYREIQVAFRNKSKNVERLKELYLHPDFLIILRKVISANGVTIEDAVLSIAALEDNLENKEAAEALKFVWPMLTGRQISDPITMLQFDTFYSILIEKMGNNPRVLPLIRHLAEQFHGINSTNGADYFKILEALEKVLIKQQFAGNFLNYLPAKTEVSPEYFMTYVNAAKEEYPRYKVSANPAALDIYLKNQLDTQFDYAEAIQYFSAHYNLPHFTTELGRLIDTEELKAHNMLAVIKAYKGIQPNRPIPMPLKDTKIGELLDSTDLFIALQIELVAMCLARAKDFTSITPGTKSILAIEEPTFVENVCSSIEAYKNLDELVIDGLAWNKQLHNAVIKRLTQNPSKKSIVHVTKLLPRFYEVCTHLGVTKEELFKALDIWKKPIEGLASVQNLETALPDIPFLNLAAHQEDNEFTKSLLSIAKEYLSVAEASQWKEAFLDADHFLFRLTVMMLSNQIIEQFPDKAYHPFKDALIGIAKGEYAVPSINDWQLLYQKADKEQLVPTALNVRDEFINHHSITNEKFAFFEILLRENGSLLERADDVKRTILQPVLVNPSVLSILIQQYHFYISLLKAGTQATTAECVRVIRDAVEQGTASLELLELSRVIDNNLYEQVIIVSAVYQSITNSDKQADVTANVKKLLETEKQLHYKISNDIVDGGDPDVGTPKKLTIVFKYQNRELTQEWNEGEFWRLPYR